MTQHTPGPWRVGDAGTTIFGPPNGEPASERVAQLCKNDSFRANARLIAAAPTQNAALIELINYLDWLVGRELLDEIQLNEPVVGRARAAIALATDKEVTL